MQFCAIFYGKLVNIWKNHKKSIFEIPSRKEIIAIYISTNYDN